METRTMRLVITDPKGRKTEVDLSAFAEADDQMRIVLTEMYGAGGQARNRDTSIEITTMVRGTVEIIRDA